MISRELNQAVHAWLEDRIGAPLSDARRGELPVVALPDDGGEYAPFTAVRIGGACIATARQDWLPALSELTATMHPDLIFTVFGAYELSRTTLPDGYSVWGPNWHLFADAWTAVDDGRVRRLETSELSAVDYDVFWHCTAAGALAGFGIFEAGRLAALATVKDRGGPMLEIGVDVAPGLKSRGMGSAVVSAAGSWITGQRRIALATVAPFNVPSARTLRRVGMAYAFTEMTAAPGPFRVPPQPLGSPARGVELRDYYPRWAMNRDIRPR